MAEGLEFVRDGAGRAAKTEQVDAVLAQGDRGEAAHETYRAARDADDC